MFFQQTIQSKFGYWFKNNLGMEFSILDHCVDTDPTCLARSHTLPTTILFSGFGFFFRKEERIFTKLNQTRVRSFTSQQYRRLLTITGPSKGFKIQWSELKQKFSIEGKYFTPMYCCQNHGGTFPPAPKFLRP